jgi:hypothetical protein
MSRPGDDAGGLVIVAMHRRATALLQLGLDLRQVPGVERGRRSHSAWSLRGTYNDGSDTNGTRTSRNR